MEWDLDGLVRLPRLKLIIHVYYRIIMHHHELFRRYCPVPDSHSPPLERSTARPYHCIHRCRLLLRDILPRVVKAPNDELTLRHRA